MKTCSHFSSWFHLFKKIFFFSIKLKLFFNKIKIIVFYIYKNFYSNQEIRLRIFVVKILSSATIPINFWVTQAVAIEVQFVEINFNL